MAETGHGAHDHGPPVRGTLILSAVVMAATAGAIIGLARQGMRHPPPPPPEIHVARPSPPPAPTVAEAAARRRAFAEGLSRRMAQQGRLARARAAGDHARTLEIYWAGRVEEDHMKRLEGDARLHAALRRLGFHRLALAVRGQEAWAKDL